MVCSIEVLVTERQLPVFFQGCESRGAKAVLSWGLRGV